MSYIQSNACLILPYSATTINAADSGKILLTPQTAGAVAVTYTLPTRVAGLYYRFINSAPAALSGSVNITAQAGTLFGSVITGPNNGISFLEVPGSTTIRFLTAVSVLSDFIDLTCDGTNWYVYANSRVSGGITIT